MHVPSSRTLTLVVEAIALVLGIFLFVLVVSTQVQLIRLGTAQKSSSKQAAEDRRVLRDQTSLIVECTTAPADREPPVVDPSPLDCFLRQEARSATTVGGLTSYVVAAAACGAAHPGDVTGTRRCTTSALRAAGVTLGP